MWMIRFEIPKVYSRFEFNRSLEIKCIFINRFATKFIYHLLMILLLCSPSPHKLPSPILKHELLQRPKLKSAQLNTEQGTAVWHRCFGTLSAEVSTQYAPPYESRLCLKAFGVYSVCCKLTFIAAQTSNMKEAAVARASAKRTAFFSWIYELRLEGMRNLWNDSCSPIVHIIMPCTQVQIKIFMHL